MAIDEAESKQDQFNAVLDVLSDYTPRDEKYSKAKNKLLDNAKNFYEGRGKIIKGFKNGIFPLNYDGVVEEQVRYKEEEKHVRNENGLIDYKKLGRLINLKEREINDELVRKYFLVQYLGALLEKLKKSKKNLERNEIQVNLIKSALRNLKKEIENMSDPNETK